MSDNQQTGAGAVSPNLAKGLESIKAGAIPALITRELEAWLTERGLYRSSMTPEDAWLTLQRVVAEQAVETAPPVVVANAEKPAAPAPVAAKPDISNLIIKVAPSQPPVPDKNRILIAEDEADILQQLSFFFKKKGFEVLEATNGEMALQLIETARPATAILDFMMPKMDGITVCERARLIIPDLFVIIMSGVGSERLRNFSQRVKANEYVEKPLHMAALLKKVKDGIATS